MSGVLAPYTIMQQNAWSGRVFYTAQERRTGQVTYLVEEQAPGPLDFCHHPALPPLELVTAEGETRWLRGVLPGGEAMEDLRTSGRLNETDMVASLLSVVDGLASLAAAVPPLVPSYLDPACIKRDHVGRWVLDYLALAHAPEARMAPSQPLGIHPMGVLLYWMVTGQTARRTRVQVNRLPPGLSPTLQFIIIKCLGRSYPSLAELRHDLERAGREHEFRSLGKHMAQQRERGAVQPTEPVQIRVASVRGSGPVQDGQSRPLPDRLPGLSSLPSGEGRADGGPNSWNLGRDQRPPEYVPSVPMTMTRTFSGSPFIPMNDRPWAAPPRPDGGYRQAVLPPPPSPRLSQAGRWARLGIVGLLSAVIASGVAVRVGLVPEEFLPEVLKTRPVIPGRTEVVSGPVAVGSGSPSTRPAYRPVPPTPDLLDPSDGQDVAGPGHSEPAPSEGTPPATRSSAGPVAQPAPPSAVKPVSRPQPEPVRPGESSQPNPTTPPPPPDAAKPAPPHAEPPSEPSPPTPEPGSIAHLDASTGGVPYLVLLDEKPLGWAYLFPNAQGPFISLGAYNSLFGRNLYWAPEPSGRLRVYTASTSFATEDYDIANARVWLQLTPDLQRLLHIQLKTSAERKIYFLSK